MSKALRIPLLCHSTAIFDLGMLSRLLSLNVCASVTRIATLAPCPLTTGPPLTSSNGCLSVGGEGAVLVLSVLRGNLQRRLGRSVSPLGELGLAVAGRL